MVRSEKDLRIVEHCYAEKVEISIMSHQHFTKAEELAKNGQFEEALSYYNQAVNSEPKNPHYYSQRGVCFFHLKRLEKSLEDMNTAVGLEPEYSYRYASRAYIRDAKGDVSGAVADYQKAIELDPSDAVAHNNLGLLEEKLGYIEASKKNFKKADDLAKLLENTGVVTEEELLASQAPPPENIQKIVDQEKEVKNDSNVVKEMKSVLTTKASFKEFISFIKNGFKRE